jgi:hypothetical protein
MLLFLRCSEPSRCNLVQQTRCAETSISQVVRPSDIQGAFDVGLTGAENLCCVAELRRAGLRLGCAGPESSTFEKIAEHQMFI